MDVRGGVDSPIHGITPDRPRRLEPDHAGALRARDRAGRGAASREGGPLVVDTGRHTGRSPKDKFIVREPGSEERIWWDGNQELAEDAFERLREKVTDFLGTSATLYVVDAFAGADPAHRIAVRVVTTHPYHALFAKTMFIDPTPDELARLHAAGARPARARARGGPRGGRHAHRHVHRAASDAHRGADRRHVLRRRDQEVDLHGHERPAAARGRAARCTARRTSATTAGPRSSSGSPAPARRRSPPIPSAR